MGSAENKAVVARYFEAASSGDLTRAFDSLSEDAVWIVPGDWEMAGTYQGEAIRDMMSALSQFQGGLRFTHHSITAEDDRVVVQTTVEGDLTDGRHYANELVFLFVVRGDKISQVIEVPDSAKSLRFWLGK
jgi:uncharacterized protein